MEEELVKHVKEIRNNMIENAGMGQVPKISFVKDLQYLHGQMMNHLFEEMDKGPEDEENLDIDKAWDNIEVCKDGKDTQHR